MKHQDNGAGIEIGINVMSTIGAMKRDFPGTVERLRQGGCGWFELMSDWGARQDTIDYFARLTGGSSGWDPENTLRRLEVIREKGMDARGTFVFDEALEEQAEALGQYCRQAGLSYVVFTFMGYEGIDDIYRKIGLIRRVAAKLRPFGVQIFLHNHEHDVLPVTDRDGVEKPILDVFLAQLSPEELMLEADVGWLLYAGLNPAAYIRTHSDRIGILHFKDIARDYKTAPREKIFVPCGTGAVDFQAVLDAVPPEKKGTMRYAIDQDASEGDIVEDLVQALAYFRSLQW